MQVGGFELSALPSEDGRSTTELHLLRSLRCFRSPFTEERQVRDVPANGLVVPGRDAQGHELAGVGRVGLDHPVNPEAGGLEVSRDAFELAGLRGQDDCSCSRRK